MKPLVIGNVTIKVWHGMLAMFLLGVAVGWVI